MQTVGRSWREKWEAPDRWAPQTPSGFAATKRTAYPCSQLGGNLSGGSGTSFLSGSCVMRVVVSINGVKFRVPITDDTLTVGWLFGDVAARYQRHHKLESGTVSICELRGSDGSLLDATDAITDVADDMEELVGVISTTTHIVYSDDKEVGYSRASVVPEPPPGGNPMGLAANQHALRLAKEKGVEEVRVRGADEGMRMPADRMAIAEELLDSWAADAYSVLSCDGHPDGVTCLHLAHDMLLSAGRDRLVRVWDMQTRRCRAQLEGHTSNVRCLGFARGILVSGGEAAVRVWELGREMSQTGTLLGHNHFVSALSLDDDLRLVTASWDRTLRIWHVPEDGTSAQSIATLGSHTASVLSLRRVGDRAVSGSLCGEIFLWNLLTEQLVLRANSSEGMAVNAMMWERNILFCAADMDLHIIDTGTGRKVETLKGHTDVITSLVVSMPWVITGSRDATIKVWSTKTWRCVRSMSAPGVRCLSVDNAHRLLIVGFDSGEVQWWDQDHMRPQVAAQVEPPPPPKPNLNLV